MAQLDDGSREFENSLFMQIRNSLRDSDTIMHLSDHVVGVLLPFVRSTEDVELVIWRMLGKIEAGVSRRNTDRQSSSDDRRGTIPRSCVERNAVA